MVKLLINNSISYRIYRYLLLFLVTVFLFATLFYVQNGTGDYWGTFFITFINGLFFFGYAFVTIYLLIPEYLIRRKTGWFLLLFGLVGVGLSAIKLVISDHIFYSSISPENIQRSGVMNLRFIVVNIKDMTFVVALFCVAKYVRDYVFTEQARKKLEIQNREAQSKLLQSQFDPHFLFNTINNMYALSLLNPEKTREVIGRMKIVLNYIIDESQKEFVNLQDEISLVDNYVQLEKLRYGKRLSVEMVTSGDLAVQKVPPMILFFLVENCFKHGSSLDAGSPWIRIVIKAEPGYLLLATENSKPGSVVIPGQDVTGGLGLKNLRKRLEFLYSKNRFTMNILNTKNTFKAELLIKETEVEFIHEK